MYVPRKPWSVGKEYNSIFCCLSGIMYVVENFEGKDLPPTHTHKKKLKEKLSNVAKNGQIIALLLRQCEPIFHIGTGLF